MIMCLFSFVFFFLLPFHLSQTLSLSLSITHIGALGMGFVWSPVDTSSPEQTFHCMKSSFDNNFDDPLTDPDTDKSDMVVTEKDTENHYSSQSDL